MPKIALIGAGSTVFAKNLITDILNFPELAGSTLALMDIDPERLHTTELVAQRIARNLGVHPEIEATLERRSALEGADYVITMFQVAGYQPGTVIDFEIPKKYGLRQTIADTLGIGGILRGLRTIPVLLDVCRDMEALCPDATLLNYVNPMAMNMWAIQRASKIKSIGLCHSVQGTAGQLANDIGIPLEEINYLCAGINHMAFYLKFERKTSHGVEDLYPRLHQVVHEGRVPADNRVRYEILERLGYFVTESSEHFSEYTPWFIKRDRLDLIERFNVPLDEYIARCEIQITGWQLLRGYVEQQEAFDLDDLLNRLKSFGASERTIEQISDAARYFDDTSPSHEYGSFIIHSLETGLPRVVYGNLTNHNLIDNLPAGCCVEVPCVVDRNGIQPVHVGLLPPHLAALIQTNVNVQGLTVEAALTGKREHIYHAAMLDPHTAAELDLEQIWRLVDDLIEAHGDWLPRYS